MFTMRAHVAVSLLSALVLLTSGLCSGNESQSNAYQAFEKAALEGNHTNNWALLVGSSRFWFNYRHIANVVGLYRNIKRLGIPDSNIILMLAEGMACNPRNVHAGSVIDDIGQVDAVEIDYRNYDVTVENFVRVLTGRNSVGTPPSKRLLSDDRSNVFVYLSGHGGDGFFKFQDAEEISGRELADVFEQMHQKGRYGRLFFMMDTCQAATMTENFYSPNIVAVGSSRRGENSWGYLPDTRLGVALLDRFTYSTIRFAEKIHPGHGPSLAALMKSYDPGLLRSNIDIKTTEGFGPLSKVRVTDFLGSSRDVHLTPAAYVPDD